MSETISTITCDFSAPEVQLTSFTHRETGETLPELLQAESAQMLTKAYEAGVDVSTLAELEQTALNDGIEAVRACVSYAPGGLPWEEKAEGNCFTFSWLVSDVAEGLGFDSRIVFCNGHAFNLIGTPSGRYHLINGETKPMWLFDVDKNAYSRTALPDLSQVLSDDPITYHGMYTRDLAMYIERHRQPGQKRINLPWLEGNMPAAAVMTPELAHEALFTYTCFQAVLYIGNLRGTTEALHALRGINPQVETREKINDDLKIFKKNIRRWAEDPETASEDIVACVEAYQAAMPYQTKSLHIFLGDCLRRLGTIRQESEVLELADMYYAQAISMSKGPDQTLDGKRRTLWKTQETLTQAIDFDKEPSNIR